MTYFYPGTEYKATSTNLFKPEQPQQKIYWELIKFHKPIFFYQPGCCGVGIFFHPASCRLFHRSWPNLIRLSNSAQWPYQSHKNGAEGSAVTVSAVCIKQLLTAINTHNSVFFLILSKKIS